MSEKEKKALLPELFVLRGEATGPSLGDGLKDVEFFSDAPLEVDLPSDLWAITDAHDTAYGRARSLKEAILDYLDGYRCDIDNETEVLVLKYDLLDPSAPFGPLEHAWSLGDPPPDEAIIASGEAWVIVDPRPPLCPERDEAPCEFDDEPTTYGAGMGADLVEVYKCKYCGRTKREIVKFHEIETNIGLVYIPDEIHSIRLTIYEDLENEF